MSDTHAAFTVAAEWIVYFMCSYFYLSRCGLKTLSGSFLIYQFR